MAVWYQTLWCSVGLTYFVVLFALLSRRTYRIIKVQQFRSLSGLFHGFALVDFLSERPQSPRMVNLMLIPLSAQANSCGTWGRWQSCRWSRYRRR